MKNSQQKKSKRNNRNSNVDALIVRSTHAAAAGDVMFDKADLRARQPRWNLIEKPPMNFQSQIHWVQESYQTSFALSASGAVVEANQAFAINQFPGASSMTNLFDQFCIYSAVVRSFIELSSSTAPTVVNSTLGRIWTALDYDSAGPISSENSIEQYGTAQVAEVTLGKSYERYVKPCCVLVTGSQNSTSATGLAMARNWLNTANTGTPHFGIRILTAGNQSLTAPVMIVEVTCIFGLRNSI